MPNIGSVLAGRLADAGIVTPSHLAGTGAEEAFLKLRVVDEGACINCLYALEGAVRGIRWHDLDAARKTELKDFFNSLRLK